MDVLSNNDWLAPIIIIIVFVIIIGNFSTLQKSAKKPLRKQSLNDLKETIPRTSKKEKEKTTFSKK